MTRIVQSSARPARRRRISPFALLAAAVFLGAPGAALADAPAWLREAAAQPLPVYPKDTPAVLLFDDQVTTVRENGEIETVYHRAYKILKTEGREYGTASVYFDNETRLTFFRAWSLPAGGKEYEVKEKEAVETSPFDGELFSDQHFKYIRIPAAEPGNVVGYEYQQRRRPWILQDDWTFQHRIPVLKARFTLSLPVGWEYKPYWLHYAGREPQATGANSWAWELQNIPAVEIESSMPAWEAVAGRLGVSYFPRDPALQAKSQKSWQEIGRWYRDLTLDRRSPSAEIHQKTIELTSKSASTLERIQALATFVQQNVRYVAIEIGIGGFQPHMAAQIFSNKYGDCKDKATILSTMLKEAGVESYYVIVQTSRGIVAPEFPTALTFNHVILAIRLPADVDTKELYATVQHDRLGKLLYFDPTDPATPLGYIPTYEQQNRVLLVTDEGGELITLPLLAPARNRLVRTARLTLRPDGSLSGDVTETRTGALALEPKREILGANSANRAKTLESILGGSLSSFSLQSATAEHLEAHDATLILHYSFTADHYAQTAGNLLLVRPRVLGVKSENLVQDHDGERKFSFEFPYATEQSDTYEITLPAGYAVDDLPGALTLDAPFAAYHSKTDVTGNILHYQRVYQIKDVEVPSTRFDEFKKFYRQVTADERSSAVMKRTAP